MDKQYMANKLTLLRKQMGLTQADVAKNVGVSASAYSQYETGDKIPRDDTKIALAKFFKRSVQFIFFSHDTH